MQTGSTFDAITLRSLPQAEISYYNTYADLTEALGSNKIDGFPGDELENPEIKVAIEYAEAAEQTTLTVHYNGPTFDAILHGDELATNVLRSTAKQIEYQRDEQADLPNRVLLTIRPTN